MNRWIIPDIHGCAKTLQSLVESFLKITKEDHLYFLGDYIDRGPHSKEVIDYIMDLQAQGYRVHCLKGNHEDYCVKAWEEDQKFHLLKPETQRSWERVGAAETYKSFGGKRPRDIPEHYIEWMRNLDYYFELDKYILVHAGMNFNIDNPFDDTMSMMWARDFKVDIQKTGGKKIIHGHVPVEYSLIQLFLESEGYNFIALDNGVYYRDQKVGFGNLMALELNSMQLIAQPNVDF
jgi:serine/threonine protein phosphatase 1